MAGLGHQSLPPADLGRVDEEIASPATNPLSLESLESVCQNRSFQGRESFSIKQESENDHTSKHSFLHLCGTLSKIRRKSSKLKND
ncbi:hypothetical protein TNCV_833011 [Trichonephila clavipes]|uniref:Uncharacterized protein n=1 Tax=Trichonephila clavipes TaxID=2585209 RepID=A0A8X6RBF8_TRICX|nr:hypothetical protein TNCV_833011 [Trichonephila clavipes]